MKRFLGSIHEAGGHTFHSVLGFIIILCVSITNISMNIYTIIIIIISVTITITITIIPSTNTIGLPRRALVRLDRTPSPKPLVGIHFRGVHWEGGAVDGGSII